MRRTLGWICFLLAMPVIAHSGAYDYSGKTRVTLASPLVEDARSGNALRVDEVDISWRFWILMGEPVKTFVGTYRTPEAGQPAMRTLARIEDLHECRDGRVARQARPSLIFSNEVPAEMPEGRLQSTTIFRAWLAESASAPRRFFLPREKLFIDFSPDSLMPEHAGAGLGTPGSPEWDALFERSLFFGGSEYLSADEAKDVFRRGIDIERVEIIRASVDVSALRTAYNNRVNKDCQVEEALGKREDIQRRLDQSLTGADGSRSNTRQDTSLDGQLRDLWERQEAAEREREAQALQARLEELETQRLRAREACDDKAPVMTSIGSRPGPTLRLWRDSGHCDSACREARRESSRRRDERLAEAQREYDRRLEAHRAEHERTLATWKSHGHAQCLADVDADFERQRRAEQQAFMHSR